MKDYYERRCEQEEENEFVSRTDPAGSYTGNPFMTDEPEQDADDL